MHCKTSKFSYQLIWFSCRSAFESVYRMDVYGEDNIPKTGSFIVAANHASFFDPPAFGCSIPREMAYFARKTLFKEGWRANLLYMLNSIPVDRDGDSDISAFKQVFRVLKNNLGIVLFPEGTRSNDGALKPAKKGVGLFACKSQVPVIPARIFGSYDNYNRHQSFPELEPPLTVMFGAPLFPKDYDEGKTNPERYQKAANYIMKAICRLEIPSEVGAI